jgi:N-acetylglucosamine PTS system EIICBA or EIICB component
MNTTSFAKFQKLGRALMLPIAVLPVAGLLLRLGQPDLLNIKWIAQAGDAIFTNLPLIFAIGVAVGFAKENHGAAGLAGGIGYLVLTAVLKSINDKLDMGVLAGISAASWLAICTIDSRTSSSLSTSLSSEENGLSQSLPVLSACFLV